MNELDPPFGITEVEPEPETVRLIRLPPPVVGVRRIVEYNGQEYDIDELLLRAGAL